MRIKSITIFAVILGHALMSGCYLRQKGWNVRYSYSHEPGTSKGQIIHDLGKPDYDTTLKRFFLSLPDKLHKYDLPHQNVSFDNFCDFVSYEIANTSDPKIIDMDNYTKKWWNSSQYSNFEILVYQERSRFKKPYMGGWVSYVLLLDHGILKYRSAYMERKEFAPQ